MHDIEEVCRSENADRGVILRKLLGTALKEYRLKKAFESYAEGKLSLWSAARLGGTTYRGALEDLNRRNIPFRYEREDLDLDICNGPSDVQQRERRED